MKGKQVLFVATSHSRFTGTERPTGLWLDELAAPYMILRDAGCEITVASPKGGAIPIDPESLKDDASTDASRRFLKDFRSVIDASATLRAARTRAWDALFYPGGHGPLWDLASDEANAQILRAAMKAGVPVAAVCHGPAALLSVMKKDGENLFKGWRMTAFSNEEERLAGLDKLVPFLLESALTERGAKYGRAKPWSSCVVRDRNLITGQNPQSAQAVGETLKKALADRS